MSLIDYPKCSSEILSIPIDTKNFDINYIYRIFGDIAFNENLFIGDDEKSIRNTDYLELFLPTTDPSVFNVYNNFSIKNEINTVVASNLEINDPNIIINDKRVWVATSN